MYIAMYRFRESRGREEEFVEIWRNRDSYLDDVEGSNDFQLLRVEAGEDGTVPPQLKAEKGVTAGVVSMGVELRHLEPKRSAHHREKPTAACGRRYAAREARRSNR